MDEPENDLPEQRPEDPTPPWDNDNNPVESEKSGAGKRLALWSGAALLVIAILATAWYLGRNKPADNNNTVTQQRNNADDTNAVAPLTSGTDDASLNQDLKTINTGISKSNDNLTSADKSVNDQQSQIEVPTE
jgi:uncharacterized protein HemX